MGASSAEDFQGEQARLGQKIQGGLFGGGTGPFDAERV